MNKAHSHLTVFFLCVIMLLSCYKGYANDVSHEVISTGIGEDSENTAVLRDSYGFLWLGTKEGIKAYDGNGVSVYDNNSKAIKNLTGQTITNLLEKDKDIWIGTNSGVYVFDRESNLIKPFVIKTDYGVNISSEIKKILEVSKDKLWIATSGQGFFIYDKKNDSLTQNSREGSFFEDITIGADGLIYLVQLDGEVTAFKPDGALEKTYALPEYVNDKAPIYITSSGKDIWVASGSNLYKLTPETGEINRIATPGMRGNVNSLIRKPDGTIILGTDLGIWVYNTIKGDFSEMRQSRYNHKHPTSKITGISADTDDNLLMVYERGPLDIMITRNMAVTFIPLDGDPDHYPPTVVNALSPGTATNGLWIGTDEGLTYYNFDTNSFALPRQILPQDLNISSILNDGERVYIGTHDKGLFIIDKKKLDYKNYVYNENTPYTLPSNNINNVSLTSRGELLVLTDWGISKFNQQDNNFLPLTEFDQQTHAIAYQEDINKGAWIATLKNGLYYRSPQENKFEKAYWAKEIENVPISFMATGKKGNLWAASPKDGVFKYDDGIKDFRRINLPVLDNSTVMFLTVDNSGQIWIGTDKNLIQVDEDGDNHRYFNFMRHAVHYPVAGSAKILNNGKLAIGAHNGILVFEPSKLKNYETQTKVFPLTLNLPFLENDSSELQSLGLDRLLYMQQKIELPYRDNTFTINLGASRPFIESDVRYDYMLKGVDKTWNVGISQPEITYNNLPPGSYEFLLRPHGMINEPPTTLQIKILPPWYRNGWAVILYILIILAAGWLGYILINRIAQRNFKRQIKEIEIKKERETFEAKAKYFTDLVHEIRTPLMLISLPLEQLSEQLTKKNKNEEETDAENEVHIKSMQQNLDYLLGITNQLLDFRKVERNNELHLNLSVCDLKILLTEISSRFLDSMRLDNKNIDLILPEEDVIAQIDSDKLERILMNLVGNAMKYCKTGIKVSLSQRNDKITINVADDGPGIPVEEREKIFDPYYQIASDKIATTLGTGLGLAYANLIAKAHKGQISITDAPGGGSLFSLTFPKGDVKEPAKKEELIEFNAEGEDIASDESKDVAILLVEDNKELRKMMQQSLAKHFMVLTAPEGGKALELLKENIVDIIISDVMMEGVDGIELCKRVKNNIEYSHIPLILLTAKTSREAHEEGLSCGADVYLEKPFPMKQLVLQIQNLLKTRNQFREMLSEKAGNPTEEIRKSPQGKRLNKMDLEFLDKLNVLITDHIDDEEFSIDQLVQSMNMSRSSFYRKITSVAGVSPNEYLKNFRLNYAAQMLKDGARVSEVSMATGFTSSSYFAKCFKDKFGVLPSDYTASLESEQI